MASYQDVYAHHADRYEALVAREDHLGNLPRTLEELAPGHGLDVVETGAGTGRVTRILAPRAHSIRAFDAAPAMIDEARRRAAHLPHLRFDVAPHDALPVEPRSADLGIEGWAFGHAVGWNPSSWRDDVRRFVDTLATTLRPGGALVLIETMGTGVDTPFAGGHSLEPFHEFLTRELGFGHRVIRTDYAFDSVDQAIDILGFFFGERMVTRVRERGAAIVPEHTAVYVRR